VWLAHVVALVLVRHGHQRAQHPLVVVPVTLSFAVCLVVLSLVDVSVGRTTGRLEQPAAYAAIAGLALAESRLVYEWDF
jgi:hypothetical protein